jgi:predicted metal-dependent enzyme (double-stranded beta helix superfamily)
MTIIETLPDQCAELAYRVRSVVGQPMNTLLDGLEIALAGARDQYPAVDERFVPAPDEGYSRHLLHADEGGLFSIMLLVWSAGAFSPVHAHWTWCGYLVMDGLLSEQRLHWDSDTKRAVVEDCVERTPGQIVVSGPGLHEIHRLGNNGQKTAVSLHVYGVSPEAASTHVNRILPA